MVKLTLKIKLDPCQGISALMRTAEQFTESFNRNCTQGWSLRNSVELHKATYKSEREDTDLPSQLVISARMKAWEAIASARALAKKGKKVSIPQSDFCPIRFDARSATVRLEQGFATVATIEGRKKVTFRVPNCFADKISWKVCTSEICLFKGQFYLHVVVEKETEPFRSNGRAVGIDFGISRPAVTSANQFFGEKRWAEIERKNFRLKRALQAKGTKSSKRHLKKLGRKVNRFRNDCDHIISRRIVDGCSSGDTVVLEDLTDIRDRIKARKPVRRRIHGWSFSRLGTYISYKAELAGIRVAVVDPRHTSQECSRCGHIARANRRKQSEFECRSCGYSQNADLNASYNIKSRFLARNGTSVSSGLTVNQPIAATSGLAASHIL